MAIANADRYVALVRAYAVEHYERGGWDFLVECWEDDDIAEAIAGARSPREALRLARVAVGLLDERRTEVRNA